MRKGIKKQFWLSEKDSTDLKRKAQKCGFTETAGIQQLLHGYESKEQSDEQFYVARQKLSNEQDSKQKSRRNFSVLSKRRPTNETRERKKREKRNFER